MDKGKPADEEDEEDEKVLVLEAVEEWVEDADRPVIAMGILEWNEDGGGSGGEGCVTGRVLVGGGTDEGVGFDDDDDDDGRGKDVGGGTDKTRDGDVDTGEEDEEKWGLVGEFGTDFVGPEPQTAFSFKLDSGIVVARLTPDRWLLLLPPLFKVEQEDPLDEQLPEWRAAATKAVLPWAWLHFSAILQAASSARSTMG